MINSAAVLAFKKGFQLSTIAAVEGYDPARRQVRLPEAVEGRQIGGGAACNQEGDKGEDLLHDHERHSAFGCEPKQTDALGITLGISDTRGMICSYRDNLITHLKDDRVCHSWSKVRRDFMQ